MVPGDLGCRARKIKYAAFLSTTVIVLCGTPVALAVADPAALNPQADGQPAAASSDAMPISDSLSDIVVTAQKREQRVNTVPQTITVVTGDDIKAHNVESTADLVRVTPGLSYTQTQFGAQVFTLRGVGYYENSVGASPSVTVYVDEVPLPYPLLTGGGLFDLERVEVLKGPQGTLFGQNSTGGAVNFVAAKPTNTFEAGFNTSLGRFTSFDFEGYVSGPVADGLDARLAVKRDSRDPWQNGATRGDHLGGQDLSQVRLLLDWKPTENLKIESNTNFWHDGSDTQAPQAIAITPEVPSLLSPSIASARLPRHVSQDANWYDGFPLNKDNSFFQESVRADWVLDDHAILTSLTSYEHFDRHENQDISGLPIEDGTLLFKGAISSFYQEVRVGGDLYDRIHYTVGGDYERDKVKDGFTIFLPQASNAYILGRFFANANAYNTQDVESEAGFANANVDIGPNLSGEAGVRFTETDRHFAGCTSDSGDGLLAGGFNALQSVLQGAFGIPAGSKPVAGGCVNLDPSFNPVFLRRNLNEGNVSWRTGLTWKPLGDDTIVYGNVSQGFKAGNFPTLAASSTSQYTPVRQERLLATEIGFKAPLWDHRVQLNGAAFYYDYTNKQISANVADPIFGVLQRLINVPKSNVKGAELQVQTSPARGLLVSAGVTYANTRIDGGTSYDQLGNLRDLTGKPFPNSPRWEFVTDAGYTVPVSDTLDVFTGAATSFHSTTTSDIGNEPLFKIKSYVLLDLRAGVADPSGKWKFSVFAQNALNQYYFNNVVHAQDTTFRYTGLPAVYGAGVSYKF